MDTCADKFAFHDKATFEFDSAERVAHQQNKPKKAYMYFTRRVEDLCQL